MSWLDHSNSTNLRVGSLPRKQRAPKVLRHVAPLQMAGLWLGLFVVPLSDGYFVQVGLTGGSTCAFGTFNGLQLVSVSVNAASRSTRVCTP